MAVGQPCRSRFLIACRGNRGHVARFSDFAVGRQAAGRFDDGRRHGCQYGVSVGALRVQTVIGAALMTGAAVSLSGIIGFLGMMIPNVLAQTVGGSRRKLITLSAWLGAVFLMVVDGAARWLTYPVDLPVGIVIALLGGPFLCICLSSL